MTTPDASRATPSAYTPAGAPHHGRFLWYELTTGDVAAALPFYQALFGWGSTAFEGMDPPYTMFMNGEIPVAGAFALTPEMRANGVPPNWMPYVGVTSADETFAAATAAGAMGFLEPTDIPDIGRVAVLADPQGAPFGLYQPLSDPLPEATAGNGEFTWHELMTGDHVAAWAFYEKLFGWRQATSMEMGPGWIYQMYGRGEMVYGGMFDKRGDFAQIPSHWQLYVKVPSLDAAIATVTQLGGRIVRGPEPVPGGVIAQALDPQGAAFSMHEQRAS